MSRRTWNSTGRKYRTKSTTGARNGWTGNGRRRSRSPDCSNESNAFSGANYASQTEKPPVPHETRDSGASAETRLEIRQEPTDDSGPDEYGNHQPQGQGHRQNV